MSFVYRNKFGAMRNAGLAWFVMIGCLAMLFFPHAAVEPVVSHLRRLAIGYVGASVCLIISLSFLYQALRGKPVLQVDESGVAVRQEPVIPWNEIAEVKTFTKNGKPYIGVFARDLNRLLLLYPEAESRRFKLVNDQFGAVGVVAQASLPTDVDAVMAEIGDFCRMKIATEAIG